MTDGMDRHTSTQPIPPMTPAFGRWWRRMRFLLRWASFCLVVAMGLSFLTVLYLKSKPLPPPDIGITTKILDVRGRAIDQWDQGEHRDYIPLQELPQPLIQATLAAEDRQFYEHHGFSPRGILRAAWVNLRDGRVSQGASTITQQLARNLYLTHDRTWSRKWKEAVYTSQLELHFDKNEILEMYLNKIYYGHGAYGAERAARAYFGKSARHLTLAESAVLAGIPRGPRWYSPLDNPKRAKQRQAAILDAMTQQGMIPARAAEQAKNEHLVYATPPKPGPARAPWFRDAVLHEAVSRFGLDEALVRNGGLRIHTTLDLAVQQWAERAMERNLATQPDLEGALVSIDPHTGHIKAMVGGRNYQRSQFNRVFAKRQPGSTFKPVVYLAALERGLTPATRFESKPTAFTHDGKTYRPTNYHGRYADRLISMGEAIATSDNVYAVHTHLTIGEEEAVRMARRLGIQSPLNPVPSLALGTSDVSPLEMVQVYATLAAGGVHHPPTAILRIEAPDGRILAQSKPQGESVLSPGEAFVMTHMLEGVFQPGGTANRVGQILHRPVAGKTGSTDWDSWLSGFTPELATTVWLGYDQHRELPRGTSRLTHQIWGTFMRDALANVKPHRFPVPHGVVRVKIDPQSGMVAGADCPRSVTAYFMEGTQPRQTCSLHRHEPTDNKQTPWWWEWIKKWWSG
ncbi:transglycosylase domain-containing protein [Desmospora profundinema]|uniref:1A family penicillin-binding protein n=1 Tax=Desmospora profundinema TaxID=1571184 RepID=A0ABU1IMM5_9BACL|nr:PBP1A family penicillin-binding protein [Desmospora profundinema]MDR6225414.1 1A family penicillin-binding protein [Desmospora profundinema]